MFLTIVCRFAKGIYISQHRHCRHNLCVSLGTPGGPPKLYSNKIFHFFVCRLSKTLSGNFTVSGVIACIYQNQRM